MIMLQIVMLEVCRPYGYWSASGPLWHTDCWVARTQGADDSSEPELGRRRSCQHDFPLSTFSSRSCARSFSPTCILYSCTLALFSWAAQVWGWHPLKGIGSVSCSLQWNRRLEARMEAIQIRGQLSSACSGGAWGFLSRWPLPFQSEHWRFEELYHCRWRWPRAVEMQRYTSAIATKCGPLHSMTCRMTGGWFLNSGILEGEKENYFFGCPEVLHFFMFSNNTLYLCLPQWTQGCHRASLLYWQYPQGSLTSVGMENARVALWRLAPALPQISGRRWRW